MSDKLFEQLLQYRDDLLSHDFVDDIIKKIHRFEVFRTLIIVGFAVSGLILLGFGDITHINFFSGIDFEPLLNELKNTSIESIGSIMFATLCCLGVWLISSD